jgi:general L-amino acid transport system permease protein
MYGFGRGTGWTIFLFALLVGVVAFLGGHWFVDLIELAGAGRADDFLSPEHLAYHDGSEANQHFIDREIWPLPVVETSVWGGLLVTLVVAIAGIVASLPLGILLALGRRSQLPAVRILSIGFIEFFRGVPLITVLFMSSVMLPLFLPEGVEFNKLLRALIGVALFASAYMAEVVRGGLQAISKGQYEGADSLGLSYGQKMRLIVMPQALTLVIPGIVNTFIGLFKDTTLVLIIGLFDLLGAIQAANTDASWASPVQQTTGYFVAASIFFIFCFGMSRYSMFMENRLRRGHAR